MARYKIGVLVTLLALVLGISARTAAQDTPTDLENAEATIAALQTTVADQATTIAGLTGEPTPTLTAGATTPLPPSAPVDLGEGVVLSSYLFVDTVYGLYLAADLVNTSGAPIKTPALDAAFYDADGNLLGDTSLKPFLYWADTDWHIPYAQSGILGGAYTRSEIDRVEFFASPNEYNVYDEVDASNMDIVGAPVEGPDGEITARVQNNRDEPVGPLSIIYAVYDAQGNIVGACDRYLDITIPPERARSLTSRGTVSTFKEPRIKPSAASPSPIGCSSCSFRPCPIRPGRAQSFAGAFTRSLGSHPQIRASFAEIC